MVLVIGESGMTFSINLHNVKKPNGKVPRAYAHKSEGCEYTLYRKYIKCGELCFFLPYNEAVSDESQK